MTQEQAQREVEIIVHAVEKGRPNDACNVIRRIALESWKQGMTDAAAMVISVAAHAPELKNIRDKIRSKRDETKSV